MIQITLGEKTQLDSQEDPLGRAYLGFTEEMTDEQLYEANHGRWILGPRADNERFAIFNAKGSSGRRSRSSGSCPPATAAPSRQDPRCRAPGLRRLRGQARPGWPFRNPIAYFESEHDARVCGCGCGAVVAPGHFLPGHDQKASTTAWPRSAPCTTSFCGSTSSTSPRRPNRTRKSDQTDGGGATEARCQCRGDAAGLRDVAGGRLWLDVAEENRCRLVSGSSRWGGPRRMGAWCGAARRAVDQVEEGVLLAVDADVDQLQDVPDVAPLRHSSLRDVDHRTAIRSSSEALRAWSFA